MRRSPKAGARATVALAVQESAPEGDGARDREHDREQDGSAIHGESLLFDPDWYRSAYPDVAVAGIDPIRHYFDDGAREGRDPNPFFSTISYVARYADVAASRMNPFLHYLLYGAREGRTPRD